MNTVTAVQQVYTDAPESLTGRTWTAADGVVTVGERVERNGMYRCTRADGRVQLIRPSIIQQALAGNFN